MQKRISKRRWIARFMLGQRIPMTAISEHYDLLERFERVGSMWLAYSDFVIRRTAP